MPELEEIRNIYFKSLVKNINIIWILITLNLIKVLKEAILKNLCRSPKRKQNTYWYNKGADSNPNTRQYPAKIEHKMM